MSKPIPPLDLSWLLIESPASTTHVGAMLLFKAARPRAHRARDRGRRIGRARRRRRSTTSRSCSVGARPISGR